MASTPGPRSLFSTEAPVEKDITCTICLETAQVPRVLPCTHVFCERCLQKILDGDEAIAPGNLTCPNCRAEHVVPVEGVDGFPTVICESIALVSINESASETHLCGACKEGGEAVGYCSNCKAYVCESCVSVHKQLVVYDSHEVTLLKDLNEVTDFVPSKNPQYCMTHPDECVRAYCDSCNAMICLNCILGAHTSHRMQTIDDKDEELRTSVEKLRESACKNLQFFECHREYIQQVKKEFETNNHVENLCKNINEECDVFVQTIQELREQLLEDARVTMQLASKEMLKKVDDFERERTEIESALGFSSKAQECLIVPTRIAANLQVERRLKEAAEKKWKSETMKPPLVFHCKDRSQLSQLGALITPSEQHVKVEIETVDPLVGEEFSAKVSFDIPLPGLPTFKVLCSETLEIIDSIFWEDGNEWNVQFIPNTCGVHFIQISVCSVIILSYEVTV